MKKAQCKSTFRARIDLEPPIAVRKPDRQPSPTLILFHQGSQSRALDEAEAALPGGGETDASHPGLGDSWETRTSPNGSQPPRRSLNGTL
jgi:hypothetical protein